MKKDNIKKLHIDNRAFSLVELVVVIAIMVILVAVTAAVLFNGPSWNTREDIKTFDSMLSKNAMNSMSKEKQAMEMGYDSVSGQYYVDLGTYDSATGTFSGTRKYPFHKNETIKYYTYSDSESGAAMITSSSTGRNYRQLDSSAHTFGTGDKIYFFFDKARGNFDNAVIVSGGGTDNSKYIKYVYFTIKTKTRGIRLYRDTGKHEIFE